jgi:integrase
MRNSSWQSSRRAPDLCTETVSERLGHASTGFTMDTYAAVIPSMGRAAADAAERLFGQR